MASALAPAGTACGADQPAALLQQIVPPTIFAGLQSEHCCDMPGSRKRARDEQPLSNGALFQQHVHQQCLPERHRLLLLDQISSRTTHAAADLPLEGSRLVESAMASSSGQPTPATAAAEKPTLLARPGYNCSINAINALSCNSFGSIAMPHYHSSDVGALVRLQAEQMRSRLEAAYKRRCRMVIAAMEQQALQRIAEKEAELEAAAKRNAELQVRLRQAAAENQAWFDVARSNEALVARLRASLEQALLQKLSGSNTDSHNCAAAPGGYPSGAAEEEGYGDSEEEAATAAISNAATCSGPFAETSTVEGVIARRWGSSDAFLAFRHQGVYLSQSHT